MVISNQRQRHLSADSSYSTASSIGYDSDEVPQRAKKSLGTLDQQHDSSYIKQDRHRTVHEEKKQLHYKVHATGNATVTRESLKQTHSIKQEECSSDSSAISLNHQAQNIYQRKVRISRENSELY